MDLFDSLSGLAGIQAGGLAISTLGAYFSTQAQSTALAGQASLDAITAQSQASALDAQAGLDLINNKATYQSALTSAAMTDLTTGSQVISQNTKVDIGLLSAQGEYQGAVHSADSAVLQGQSQALDLRTTASVHAIQAGSQAAALQAGAQISTLAANFHELQAQSALLQGQYQETNARMKGAQIKSAQRVRFAAGGIDMAEGSGVSVLTGIDLQTEQAANEIRQETLMRAFGERMQEEASRTEAAMKTYQAGATLSQSALETGLTEAKANYIVANVNAQADLQKALAGVNLNIAGINATATKANIAADASRSDAQTAAQRAIALAGFNMANASVALKQVMTKVNLNNALAASATKQATASSMSPITAGLSTLLTGGAQVATSWANFARVAG